MQLTLMLVLGGVLGLVVLNVVGPLIATWKWLRDPDRVHLGR